MKKAPRAVEWVAGAAKLPGFVVEDGESFRPEVLVFVVAGGGPIVGQAFLRTEEIIGAAVATFRESTRSPLAGPPHVPARLRVASKELADAMRGALAPATEVICAATPEIDELAAHMVEHFAAAHAGAEASYPKDADPSAMAGFFRATARLHRAKPWLKIPADHLVRMSIPALGVDDGVLSIIGQAGEAFGTLYFKNEADFDAFTVAASLAERGERPKTMPAHEALNFERGAEIPPGLRKTIAHHSWEVAGPDAYPEVMIIEPDLVLRPPLPKDYAFWEVVALAVAEFAENEDAIPARLHEEGVVDRTMRVDSSQGPIDVTLVVEDQDDTPDPGIYEAIGRYVLSVPENPLGVHWIAMVLDLVDGTLEKTPHSVTPDELRRVILAELSLRIAMPPQAAFALIGALHSFFDSVGREDLVAMLDEKLAAEFAALVAPKLPRPKKKTAGSAKKRPKRR